MIDRDEIVAAHDAMIVAQKRFIALDDPVGHQLMMNAAYRLRVRLLAQPTAAPRPSR